jgi:NTP pyrophosphatase (non-canonical NTP hydrolase)
MSSPDSLAQLQARLRMFASERGWEQYHTPKNLTAAIAGEAGELAAVLQWYAPGDDLQQHLPALEEEMADILIYLTRLAPEAHAWSVPCRVRRGEALRVGDKQATGAAA